MNSKYNFLLIWGGKGWILSIITITVEGSILYFKTRIFYVSNGISMNSRTARLKAKNFWQKSKQQEFALTSSINQTGLL